MAVPLPALAAADEQATGRPPFEVADVVRAYGATFLSTQPTSASQRRVLRAIGRCRTAALGGHVEGCDACGYRRVAYNSCRNRHCPKCQGAQRAQWLAAEQALLLPVPYFHVIFTLPHSLNPLLRTNPRRLYALLFASAAATLQHCARRRGVELGITMVLHTWGQTLTEHVHVHCVVTGGGLTRDGQRWKSLVRTGSDGRPVLFSVRRLSRHFRRAYLEGLQRHRAAQHLRFVGASAPLADPLAWADVTTTLQASHWVVYAQPPFGSPDQVLKYLSRYTHRVAIANTRLTHVGQGHVRFTYINYADHRARRELTLSAVEFLRRFLLHVVPTGFMRIRHYGILANCTRAHKLARCRALLHVPAIVTRPPPLAPAPAHDAADHHARCPHCGGRLRVVELLAPHPLDTS